jgi:hypothetical protein
VKRLIDAAVVIVAVIIPALGPQRFQEILHPSRPLFGAAVRAAMGAPAERPSDLGMSIR